MKSDFGDSKKSSNKSFMQKQKGKLILVSNRLPVNIVRRSGEYRIQPSAGGVATGLASVFDKGRYVWLGWAGMSSERAREAKEELEEKLLCAGYHPIFLRQADIDNFYHGFCNRTIWPLFHYFPSYTVYDDRMWESYKNVNQLYADAVLELADEDDIIWVHDYHLMLLPSLLREKLPRARIGFFLHIPFPSYEIFRLLPWRAELLKGLLGADLVGFHIYDYVFHFLDSIRRILGLENSLGQINDGSHIMRADAFPMSIDFEKYHHATSQPGVQHEMRTIRTRVGPRRLILSVDRLDYSKGIPNRLEAFDFFLERNPDFRGEVTLILVVVPSRIGVEQYRVLKRQIDELVGRINGKYATIGWMPVWYMYRYLPFDNLTALYGVCDVALITPLRDGMNLIAKEYVSARRDGRGVLILSEMAGAARELSEAIVVNPNNVHEMAEAIYAALTMPEKEQVKRNRSMQDRIRRYDITRWVRDFMDRLEQVRTIQQELRGRILHPRVRSRMVSEYRKASRRLIFLDYDGTLTPFARMPEEAAPDEELYALLKGLQEDRANDVVIISGRDKQTLDRWFGSLKLNLVAEHGAFIKHRGGRWRRTETADTRWKEEIRPIMEMYVDRTPGSFLEEKEYSLAWHYRAVEAEMAIARAGELKDTLLHLTANLDVSVLEGNKVIEVKHTGVNKGRAARHWLEKDRWEFIFCAGDDWTDEDMFEAMPEDAYSVKVGYEF